MTAKVKEIRLTRHTSCWTDSESLTNCRFRAYTDEGHSLSGSIYLDQDYLNSIFEKVEENIQGGDK